MIGLFALLAIAALAASSRARPAAPNSPRPSSSKDLAARIVQETKDIIDGKRDAYSVDPEAVDAELERARKAVALAKQKEAQTPKQPSVTVGPVQTRPAAAKPAPAGTDLALAKKTSTDVATHLKAKNISTYSRDVVRLWQTRAGLKPDGIYGRGTETALRYFGAKPPKAFFAQGTASYTPPA